MASNLKPVFGYTIFYVNNVAKSVHFYSKAIGYNVHRLDESHRWGELESGQTTIAFAPKHQHETDGLTGLVQFPKSDPHRPPMELCLVYCDVDAAFKFEEQRAAAVSQPEHKQRLGTEGGIRARHRWHDGEDGKPRSATKARLID